MLLVFSVIIEMDLRFKTRAPTPTLRASQGAHVFMAGFLLGWAG